MTDETNEILRRLESLLTAILRRSASEVLGGIRTDKKLRQIFELTGSKDGRMLA